MDHYSRDIPVSPPSPPPSEQPWRVPLSDVLVHDKLAGRLLTLPLFAHMSDEQVGLVVGAVLEALAGERATA